MYFVEKTKNVSIFKRYDYLLIIAVLILTGIGLAALNSATATINGGQRMMLVQTISVIAGVPLAILFSLMDYKVLKSIGFAFYIATILLLVLVLKFGFGREATGSNSWLMIPGVNVSMQPAEAAKISFIIMLAYFLERIDEGQGKYNYLKLIGFSALPVGLVLLQPDIGTAIVFIVIFATMLFVWGIKYRFILLTFGVCAAAAPLAWFLVLGEEAKSRIMVFLNPGLDPSGAGYQVDKAKMAIGSGRMFGLGLGNGIQSQNPVGIPVKESDSIIAVIGEEMGFIATSAIMLLVIVILIRCLIIARNSRDKFGSYITAGITGMFAFHFFENIGMNLGVLPMTGIPLPFVSQGGTVMLVNYMAIGIVLSISLRRKRKQHAS